MHTKSKIIFSMILKKQDYFYCRYKHKLKLFCSLHFHFLIYYSIFLSLWKNNFWIYWKWLFFQWSLKKPFSMIRYIFLWGRCEFYKFHGAEFVNLWIAFTFWVFLPQKVNHSRDFIIKQDYFFYDIEKSTS